MSISINSNYLSSYGIGNGANLANTSASNSQQTSGIERTFGDYMQLASSNEINETTGNYNSSTTNEAALTTEQKTAYLEMLLKRIESTDTSENSTLPESLKTALNSVSDILSNFDASNSSGEKISSLFTSVKETMEKAKPSKEEMLANGMMPPPINMNTVQSEDAATETTTELSVDQMKEFIANLISTLSSDDNSNDSISNSLSTSLTDQLFKYNETTATDEEVQALFENLMNQLQAAQQNTEAATSSEEETIAAFPNSIQMTGTSLPPFNWKPTSGATASAAQTGSYTSAIQV